jgi:hypothetical protein
MYSYQSWRVVLRLKIILKHILVYMFNVSSRELVKDEQSKRVDVSGCVLMAEPLYLT